VPGEMRENLFMASGWCWSRLESGDAQVVARNDWRCRP
jgi:hypothetical protein